MDRVIYGFILEYWKLVKQYSIDLPKDQNEWDILLKQSEDIYKRHDNGKSEGRFFKRLILDWYDYLVERQRENKQ